MGVFYWVEIEACSRVFLIINAVPAVASRQAVEGSHSTHEKAQLLNSVKSVNRAARFKGTADSILGRNVPFVKGERKFGSKLIFVGRFETKRMVCFWRCSEAVFTHKCQVIF